MGTALLILLLLALCGFIAYIGDLLGRRLGKKRLSIFGLRPKHTAILLTVVTGVLIAAVTFGAALATVPWFREAVTRGESLRTQNVQLEAQNTERRRENERLVRESQRIVDQNTRLVQANARLADENKKLSGQNSQLARQNTSLQGENSTLRAGNANLRTGNAALRVGNAKLQADLGKLGKERSRLSANVGRLDREVAALRLEKADYQARNYIFRGGQQIFRARTIPPNPPQDVLREMAAALVSEVQNGYREQAALMGIKLSAAPVVVRMAPADGTFQPTDQLGPLQQWLIRQSRRQNMRNRPMALAVTAQENCVEGRPVLVRVHCFANERVFQKGDEIARREVDGSTDEGAIIQQLLVLVQSQLRSTATRAPYSMLATDEGVGEVSWSRLLETMRRVKEIDGRVTVVVVARQDTMRAGPLNVDLEVRSVGRPAAFHP